jgi:hypothetical protein
MIFDRGCLQTASDLTSVAGRNPMQEKAMGRNSPQADVVTALYRDNQNSTIIAGDKSAICLLCQSVQGPKRR